MHNPSLPSQFSLTLPPDNATSRSSCAPACGGRHSKDEATTGRALSPADLRDATVVCIITGHGLKDPDTALHIEADMQEVPADLAAVEAAMGLS